MGISGLDTKGRVVPKVSVNCGNWQIAHRAVLHATHHHHHIYFPRITRLQSRFRRLHSVTVVKWRSLININIWASATLLTTHFLTSVTLRDSTFYTRLCARYKLLYCIVYCIVIRNLSLREILCSGGSNNV